MNVQWSRRLSESRITRIKTSQRRDSRVTIYSPVLSSALPHPSTIGGDSIVGETVND